MNKKLKIVTIGGGSSYTPELVEGIIKRYDIFPVSEYWLVDIEEGIEKLDIITAFTERMIEKSGLPIKVFKTLNRDEALKDADFVMTQLRVGQLKARALDESIPLKYDMIGQETCGAGGMFKALRTIPILLDISKDMAKLCPNAWLINFTNPASIVTEALLRHGEHKKILGLCNVPIHMEMIFAKVLGVEKERITTRFGGLNHLVYALNVYLDGNEITENLIEELISSINNESLKNIKQISYEPDFVRELKVIPCPYLQYYYKPKEMLFDQKEKYKNKITRAIEVMEYEKELFNKYKDPNLKTKPKELENRGGAFYSDAACNLMESIYNDKKDIQVVNVQNNGTIHGIPDESSIECSCVIGKNGATPLNIGKLPIQIHGLISQVKSFEMKTIEASMNKSKKTALLALTINPLTTSDKDAKLVVDELFIAHEKYLKDFS